MHHPDEPPPHVYDREPPPPLDADRGGDRGSITRVPPQDLEAERAAKAEEAAAASRSDDEEEEEEDGE